MSSDIEIKIKATAEGVGEVKKLETQLSALGKIDAFRTLKKDVENSKAAWAAAQEEVAKLAREIAASKQPTRELSNSFTAAKKTAAELKNEFAKNQKSLSELRTNLSQAGINTKNLSEEQKKLAIAVAQTRSELSKASQINLAKGMLNVKAFKDIRSEITNTKNAYTTLKKSGTLSLGELYKAKLSMRQTIVDLKNETSLWANSVSNVRTGLVTLTAVGYAAVKSFSGYSEFSQRMAEINTLLDISDDKFKSLTMSVKNLSTKGGLAQTASELAAAEYDIISAGVALEDSVGVLGLSAKAAIAGVTDTQTAANVGIGAINAYGKSITELGSIYDILFTTVKLGVTTFPQLAQHLGEVLPTARSAGVELNEVAAAIAAMTKAGIRTPQAATSLKGAIVAMASPAPEARKKFEELDITWQGLLPTLDAIRKKSLTVDQMRLLIPDVEARTGVLALTQNLDGLQEIMDGMDNSSGAMQNAYAKMKDTPENQIKLFKNEITSLTIELGGLISAGLLPAIREFRSFRDGLSQADPLTKTMVYSMTAAGAAFTLWKVGLGTVVLGLESMAVQAGVAGAGLAGLAATSAIAGAGVAAAAALGAYEIGVFVKAVLDAKDAAEHAQESQENLYRITGDVMTKFAKFADVKLPADLTGTAPEEIEELRQGLQKAKAYWVALQTEMQSKAEETTFLGTATKEAIEAQAQLQIANQRIAEIDGSLAKIKGSGEAAGEGMKKPAEAVNATKEQLDEFEKQAKSAYESATAEAKKYAEEVVSWEEKIRDARMSTEDKLRELSQKTMTDEQAWNDERLQADEKLYAAKEALRNGDYELAESLAKDAEGLYAGLAEEIKSSTGDGEEAVVKTLETTTNVAKQGVQNVGDFMASLYTKQKENAQTAQATWESTASIIKAKLDEIAKDRVTNVSIELKNLAAAQTAINALTKDETKYITVVTKHVEANQTGGPVGFARGGRLPGYGGGDKIRALLEAGEFVIRKEAVSKYGVGLFHALNAMKADFPNMIKARVGGLISNLSIPSIPVQKFATGGMAMTGGPSETLVVRFQAGDIEAPVKITDPGSRAAMKKMATELSRMRLVYGKKV